MVLENPAISEQFAGRMEPVFASREDFLASRDEFYSKIKPELDALDEKRRRSEEAAQIRRYR